ncbi:MAG: hypothetical protein NVSMB25_21190 [Thermoleophilaceae bacterium]
MPSALGIGGRLASIAPDEKAASRWYIALWAALSLVVPIAGLMIGLVLIARRSVAAGIAIIVVAALGAGLWTLVLS